MKITVNGGRDPLLPKTDDSSDRFVSPPPDLADDEAARAQAFLIGEFPSDDNEAASVESTVVADYSETQKCCLFDNTCTWFLGVAACGVLSGGVGGFSFLLLEAGKAAIVTGGFSFAGLLAGSLFFNVKDAHTRYAERHGENFDCIGKGANEGRVKTVLPSVVYSSSGGIN